ncbi:SpoIID/LytB domain-containing protein, partial [candidate division WOR-3 bacterium]|nr:SpoIID/LytB domain-containing protein [candidate division WOR-3 bacterium]
FADGGEVVCVNELGLEEYLFGVVPCEIGPIAQETFEAVKAQAVAARSFTLTRLKRRRHPAFDLYDSFDRDQEYRGAGRETELGRRAVEQTRGEVLFFRGEVCEALYHACCGGKTGNGSRPYLSSVHDTPGRRSSGRAYCSGSGHFRWEVAIPSDSVDRALARQLGRSRLGLRGLALEKDRQSGRVRKVRVSASSGTHSLTGEAVRTALGLKSTAFDVRKQGSRYRFSGRGWGHGSGMCQAGALAMARAGRTHRQILLHYYSGVETGRAY